MNYQGLPHVLENVMNSVAESIAAKAAIERLLSFVLLLRVVVNLLPLPVPTHESCYYIFHGLKSSHYCGDLNHQFVSTRKLKHKK